MTEQRSETLTTSPATSFPWPPVLLVAVSIVAWILTVLAPLPWPGLDDTAAHLIGGAFGVVGLLLVVLGFGTLIANRTTFLPHRSSTRLVTSGPFVRFRNPIYLGEVLLLLFAAEITQSIWFVGAALLFAVLVTVLQIVPEERHLEAAFGEEYLEYKARSRRWI
jgi:protein-S-isoprenylcysteine O-methyltransferase Ste14